MSFATEAAEALGTRGVDATLFATDLGHVPGSGQWRRVGPDELPPNVDELDLHLFPVGPPRRLVHSPSMRARLECVVAEFDLVHIHTLWLFPQFAAQRAAQRAGVPYIVSPHGALDPYLRRHGRVRKAVTDLAWQRRMLANAAALHITTAQEGELIADIAPRTPREIVPVGISVERLLAPGDAGRFSKEAPRGTLGRDRAVPRAADLCEGHRRADPVVRSRGARAWGRHACRRRTG